MPFSVLTAIVLHNQLAEHSVTPNDLAIILATTAGTAYPARPRLQPHTGRV